MCDKSFSIEHSLKRHINVDHDGIKPFNCDICKMEFYTKKALEDHTAKIHDNHEKHLSRKRITLN